MRHNTYLEAKIGHLLKPLDISSGPGYDRGVELAKEESLVLHAPVWLVFDSGRGEYIPCSSDDFDVMLVDRLNRLTVLGIYLDGVEVDEAEVIEWSKAEARKVSKEEGSKRFVRFLEYRNFRWIFVSAFGGMPGMNIAVYKGGEEVHV